MSSVLHPVGPEDKGTYWRRRLVTIVVLLVVIVLAAVGIRSLTTSDDAAAQQQQKIDPNQVATTLAGTPTAGPTGTPGVSTGGTPTEDPTGSPTQTSATATGPCEAAALTVALTSDATTYGPGKPPRLVLTVSNTSDTPCTAEIGTGMRTLVATDAAGTRVWSTADCEASTGSQVFTLAASGATSSSRSMTTVWSRLHSATGCPADQKAVDNGTYTVTGTWNDITAAPLTLSLTS